MIRAEQGKHIASESSAWVLGKETDDFVTILHIQVRGAKLVVGEPMLIDVLSHPSQLRFWGIPWESKRRLGALRSHARAAKAKELFSDWSSEVQNAGDAW